MWFFLLLLLRFNCQHQSRWNTNNKNVKWAYSCIDASILTHTRTLTRGILERVSLWKRVFMRILKCRALPCAVEPLISNRAFILKAARMWPKKTNIIWFVVRHFCCCCCCRTNHWYFCLFFKGYISVAVCLRLWLCVLFCLSVAYSVLSPICGVWNQLYLCINEMQNKNSVR